LSMSTIKLGREGVKEIIQIDLSRKEKAELQKSVATVEQLVNVLKDNGYLK